MKLGLMTDSLSGLSFDEMLDVASSLGITELEFPTGGWSTAPHLDIDSLLEDEQLRAEFLGKVRDNGLKISALNINGNQLHPEFGDTVDELVHKTVDLAHMFDVDTVVCMSGLPGGAPGERTSNWVTTSWPPETGKILDYQWNEIAIPYWRALSKYGEERGVRFAVEMHGHQLVYNAATLLRLREAVGPNVGANLDPSHPMWMGADPRQVARALEGAIHNVHAKDVRLQPEIVAVQGVLDTQPVDKARTRAWNFVTMGNGYPGGKHFWGQFLTDLRAAGYDGVLAIENEDIQMDAVEGVRQCVRLLEDILLVAPPSWRPADI